jgi:hypothetical protein
VCVCTDEYGEMELRGQDKSTTKLNKSSICDPF